MARPTALGVGLLSFVVYWGDFTNPLLYLDSERLYTLPIALQLLQQMNRSEWSLLMAAVIITTIIPILLFAILQPYFARAGE
jgi:multiple sugar transport system permease protein